MSRDPIANRIAQPLVDRLGIDPRAASDRFGDLFLLAAITASLVNVATITMRPVLLGETIHVLGAFAVRHLCRTAAAQGPVYLTVQPYGLVHLLLRIAMYQKLTFAIMEMGILIHLGIAGLVPISMFRLTLGAVEATLTLVALYLSICRRPPPRRRTSARHAWT